MATYEVDTLMQTKDESGNRSIHYPITKAENVTVDAALAEAVGAADETAAEVLAALAEKSGNADSHAANQENPHGVTAEQAGADKAGTAASAVSAHNADTAAHEDIRKELAGKEASGAAAAVQSNLDTHAGDTTAHATAAERNAWNAKSGKAETFAVTLSAAGWSGTSQTISESRILKDGYTYAVAPDFSNFEAYGKAMIYAENISADGQLVFHCSEAPTEDLTVNILRVEGGSGLVLNAGGAGGGGSSGSGIALGSLTVTTPPTKTSYIAGESFDKSGMVVEAAYMVGAATIATAEVTGYAVTPSVLTDGTTEVTITYTEGGVTVSTTQAVTVTHRLESIEVTTQPSKTSYEYTDSFQSAGMVVKATYSDGATANVTGFTCSPTSLNTVGTQAITVSYTENGVTQTCSISVTVERKSISTVPSQSGTLTYTGSAQSPSWNNYSATQLTLGGVTSGTDAGSYNATFTPTANYRWSDGSTTAKTVAWSIGKANGSVSLNPSSMTLDMNNKTKTIAVTRAGDGTISAESGNTAAATVSVSGTTVTVTGVANGSATITVSVAEGTNHKAASATCAVTVSFLDDTFANNSWEAIIAACQSGSVPDTWVVGNSKTMTINGTDYQIDIIGKNHDSYADGSGTAPLTFQMHDCYGTTYAMNSSNTNAGGWTDCAMRSTHLPAVLALMPSEVQAGIREVNKLTSAGSQSATINTTADKLFLLSEIEIFGSVTYSKSGEGSQYAYYSAGNSKVKNRSGSAGFWWERSPSGSNSTYFCRVISSGSANNSYASNSSGVAFGFCF